MPRQRRWLSFNAFLKTLEEDNDSKIDQRRAQPPGAVHNPHDPEAQWSRKGSICTKDKEWVGYKAHVAESVELPVEQKNEPTQAVLTVVTEATPASDKSAIPRVEAELQDRSQPLYRRFRQEAA